jgi:hypothetical protein
MCKLSLTVKLNLSVMLTVKNYFETFDFFQLNCWVVKKTLQAPRECMIVTSGSKLNLG